MKLIGPVALTDAMLVSSTVAEDDYAAWDAAASYVIGDRVIRVETHRIYENLIAGVDASAPETQTGGATPLWLDTGPTNRWAMFDDEVGSVTSGVTPLSVVITPGQAIAALALLETAGTSASVVMKDVPGGTVVYTTSLSLDESVLTGFADFFFLPYVSKPGFALTDLPDQYLNPELTITIASSAMVSCGVCKFGSVFDLGGTEFGASLGIIDYSRKDTNEFGRVVITPRRFIKTLSVKVMMERVILNQAFRILAGVRAIPTVWVATDVEGYEVLTIFGFYRDLTIDTAYSSVNYCTLTIEGLI